MTPEVCPHCGAEVPRNARACPECGADEQTGWAEGADESGLALPDEEFDYEKFVRKEFGSKNPAPEGIHWVWWVVAVVLLIILLSWWIR